MNALLVWDSSGKCLPDEWTWIRTANLMHKNKIPVCAHSFMHATFSLQLLMFEASQEPLAANSGGFLPPEFAPTLFGINWRDCSLTDIWTTDVKLTPAPDLGFTAFCSVRIYIDLADSCCV